MRILCDRTFPTAVSSRNDLAPQSSLAPISHFREGGSSRQAQEKFRQYSYRSIDPVLSLHCSLKIDTEIVSLSPRNSVDLILEGFKISLERCTAQQYGREGSDETETIRINGPKDP